jgi:pyruvate dehydrogenase E2 component (dihydrolipoamide acetyltransferase)
VAQVSISITRDNGLQMNASATVEDADVAGIAATLAGLVVTGADAPARPRKARPGLDAPAPALAPEAPVSAPAPTPASGPALGDAAPAAPTIAPAPAA